MEVVMSDDRLTQLLALCEAATEGPWTPEIFLGGLYAIALKKPNGDYIVREIAHVFGGGRARPHHNATFIATARTALPDALKALVKCREALEVAADAFDEIRGDWSDPRDECRRGRSACNEALAAIEQVGGGDDG